MHAQHSTHSDVKSCFVSMAPFLWALASGDLAQETAPHRSQAGVAGCGWVWHTARYKSNAATSKDTRYKARYKSNVA